MDWLFEQREQISVLWLLLSGVIGGFAAAGIRYVFEDVLRPRGTRRRETRAIVRRYTAPLLRTAESLERRVDILVRTASRNWFDNDEYFRVSTLFVFGTYLGWINIIERAFGFLPFETSRRGRTFNRQLYGIFRGLCSQVYFQHRPIDLQVLADSEVPRFMLRAIGEVMTVDDKDATIGFSQFLTRYANDHRFRRYFAELEKFLGGIDPLATPLRWDRLIAAEANLWCLLRLLDPRGEMLEHRPVANLEKITDEHIRQQLMEETAKVR